MEAEVDDLLRRAAADGDVPGVVACVSDRSGTLYEGGFGTRCLGQSTEMTPDTVVWIASMTKAITCAAAMQLVERGKLSLDAPAKSLVPHLGDVRVLEGFDAAGMPKVRPPSRDITLAHLLSHTAGFSYGIWNEDIARYQEVMGLPDVNSGKDRALTTPLLFDPGERWEYGINIDWVGKLIEIASGQKLGEYLQANVLEPLGMQDTAFFISPTMRDRLATMHNRGADSALSPNSDFEIPQAPEFEAGGHGLYSTARDYLRFVRMMLNEGRSDNGEPVLTRAAAARMSTNAIGSLNVTPMKTANPELSNHADFFPGIEKRWTLGFMINDAVTPTGRSIGSLSWAGLSNSYYWIDQRKGIGGVFVTQILPFFDEKTLDLYYEFEKLAYQG
jgi:CubicO group peptidase (beta-lactamase class C family)